MALCNTIEQARQALSELDLSEKNRAFLEKCLGLIEPQSIQELEVGPTTKGGRVVVYQRDGDRKEFADG